MANDWEIQMKIIGHGKLEEGILVLEMSKHMSKENLNVVDLSTAALERAWMICLVLSMLESKASCKWIWTSAEYDGVIGCTSETGRTS